MRNAGQYLTLYHIFRSARSAQANKITNEQLAEMINSLLKTHDSELVRGDKFESV
jgi:hypothetical protein